MNSNPTEEEDQSLPSEKEDSDDAYHTVSQDFLLI